MTGGWIGRVAGTPAFAEALRELNRVRRRASGPSERAAVDAAADALLDRPSERLAVYGSLAPGEVNDHVLAPLDGRWEEGVVRGEVHRTGWGADHGFPGLEWRPDAEPVAVRVFVSADLPEHWDRIDAFEGPDYDRVLVPVEGLPEGKRVCNIYAVAGSTGGGG